MLPASWRSACGIIGCPAPTKRQGHDRQWADKEKVEVQIDFITSQGNKLLLTGAAQAQAKSGHDIFALTTWLPSRYANVLVPMNDVMDGLIKQNGPVNEHRRVSRQGQRPVARRAGDRGQPDQGAVLAHRPDEAARRHRRAGDVSRRRAAQGRQLDLRRLPEGGRGLPQGRLSLRHRARHYGRQRRHRGRDLQRLRRHAGRRQGQHHGQERCRAAGTRLLQAARCLPAAGCAVVGRRLQQQVADLRPRRPDHESAERLGGGQARCAQGLRAAVDARLCRRTEGPLRAVRAVLLERLELQQEPVGGQEPDRPSVAARPLPRRWSRRAPATTCRRSPSSPPSRHGPRRGRPRARSTTIPTRTITRPCRSRPSRRRTRSPSRSPCRRCRRRWWCAT